jgi:hypothetical protein
MIDQGIQKDRELNSFETPFVPISFLGGDRLQGSKACACEEDQLEQLSSIHLMFQDTACFLR